MNTNCPIVSLKNTIIFSSRDFSTCSEDAWLYGIVAGWSTESLKELKIKFNWSEANIKRLKNLHSNFNKLEQVGNS